MSNKAETNTGTNGIRCEILTSEPFTFSNTTTPPCDDIDDSFMFVPTTNNTDPFANIEFETTQTNHNNTNTNSNTNQNPPTPPVINPNDIDHDAAKLFLQQYNTQISNQWCCNVCKNYNSIESNACESCEAINNNNNISIINEDNQSNSSSLQNQFAYYDILNANNEILQYNDKHHPNPQYFPYDHENKEKELHKESPNAWKQFDDSNQDEINNPKVHTYREYKKRRMICKQQIEALNCNKNRKHNMLIAVAGVGSVGGQLGVGNASVTNIPNNISPFPFIMESLANKQIKQITTGIQSTAVITEKNELFVWGVNDLSSLTINPININSVDIDDCDQLYNGITWEQIYKYYYQKISSVYKNVNPAKLRQDATFIETLLHKQRYGKVIMKCGDMSQVKEGYLDKNKIPQIIQQFRNKCNATNNISNTNNTNSKQKQFAVHHMQQINTQKTTQSIHELYIKICNKYNISNNERAPSFFKETKLNPYKYIKCNSDDITITDTPRKRPKYKLNRTPLKIDPYEYKQNDNINDEDLYQKALSYSYWTPASVRLPYKMIIQSVTLGGSHMVVLDNLGQVWSSGTFRNNGVVGHHYDHITKKIIRYQRTLYKISSIASQKDGLAFSQITKNKILQPIKKIASGADHFVMLDCYGEIWMMGVTKLGQKWSERNASKYLSPHRINSNVITTSPNKNNKKRHNVKFLDIACGNYHNIAISYDRKLYSWGQNVWLQCGYLKEQSGYNNVIDQPRLVPFYENKINLNDNDEINKEIEQYQIRVSSVVAGEHMTIVLDISGNVWTCGRNACGALGRETKCNGDKKEAEPDVMRMVKDLEHIKIDWIGCGSLVWFAHNEIYGAVYAFGDSSNGRGGIGQWMYSRGRTVFDAYNMDLNKYEISNANGGSNHVVFTIKCKEVQNKSQTDYTITKNTRKIKRRSSEILSIRIRKRKRKRSEMNNDIPETSIIEMNNDIHE
eukprot:117766_1